MNAFETTSIRGLLITALVGMLMACGGGGGGSSSESVVARGVITNLGSIWVNGVEYETPDGGSYKNDDSISDIASYVVGQVVSLKGSRNSDGVSGTADEVEYEAEIEGAAGSGNTINGVTIITDQTLTPGTRYEVSGFWVNNTTLHATFIKVDDDDDSIDEVKGVVDAVDLTSITVNGVTYLFIDASMFFSKGNIVEVHFDPTTNPLVATKVELEDDFFDNPDDGLEAEKEGTADKRSTSLSNANCPVGATFLVDATCVDTESVPAEWMDGLASIDDLVTGSRVEVEGHFNAGVLIAEKVKGRGNRVRISAIVSNFTITGGSGTLDVFGGAIQVTTESGLTEIEDPILNGDGFEIRGIRTGVTSTGAPSVLALRIRNDSVNSSDHELRAEVDLDGADSTAGTITVMGITSTANSSTQLEIEDVLFTGTLEDFLGMIDDDNDPTNGPRDIVDVRIDTNTFTADQIEIEIEDN